MGESEKVARPPLWGNPLFSGDTDNATAAAAAAAAATATATAADTAAAMNYRLLHIRTRHVVAVISKGKGGRGEAHN